MPKKRHRLTRFGFYEDCNICEGGGTPWEFGGERRYYYCLCRPDVVFDHHKGGTIPMPEFPTTQETQET